MTEGLTWGLGVTVPYTAGGVLSAPIRIVAPEDGNYYIVGALYSAVLAMYSGTLFGLLQTPDTILVGNNPSTLSVWSFKKGEELDLIAEFMLSSTGCVLAIFLYKMTEDIPDLGTDVMVSSVWVSLVSPTEKAAEDRNIVFSGLLGATIIAMMLPVMTGIGGGR